MCKKRDIPECIPQISRSAIHFCTKAIVPLGDGSETLVALLELHRAHLYNGFYANVLEYGQVYYTH